MPTGWGEAGQTPGTGCFPPSGFTVHVAVATGEELLSRGLQYMEPNAAFQMRGVWIWSVLHVSCGFSLRKNRFPEGKFKISVPSKV